MTSKDKALKKKGQMKKVSHSMEFCNKCGEKVSSMVRHESGHREYDHEKEKHEDIRNDIRPSRY